MGVITRRKAKQFSGVAADMASIPAGAKTTGDIYYQTDTKAAYVWDGAAWQGPVPADWITATMLKTDSVETTKIVALNVTTGKIALLAVTAAQLGALAVETAKINNLAVTNGKLALLSVAAAQLQTDAVETLKIKDANVTLAKLADDAKCKFGTQLLHVQDQKASGTQGGTFTQAAWRTRLLNTVLTNEITGASLATNQITLEAGTYFIIASAPGYFCANHKAKLYNITDASDELIGTSENAASSDVQSRSFVTGRFTLAGTKALELQHQCATTSPNFGFGVQTTVAVVEVYADVMIWRLS